MVGNDIVDMRDSDTDPTTQSPGFDARVFCDKELFAIEGADDPVRARWRRWAAKEAAYKLARKLDPAVVFSPRRFETEWAECDESVPCLAASLQVEARHPLARPFVSRSGRVIHGGSAFELRVDETADWVHARVFPVGHDETELIHGVAGLDAAERVRSGGEAPGISARHLVRSVMARRLGIAGDALHVESRGRIPRLVVAGRRSALDLSISHHGRWVSFASSVPAEGTGAGTDQHVGPVWLGLGEVA